MCRFSAGPWKTMSRSSGVSSQNGTLVRTPMAPQTCFMRSHMRLPQGSTAPSSMEMDSSGTSEASFTVRTTPVPSQVGHAPPLLNARSSAPGPKNFSPQAGQLMGWSVATAVEGGAYAPQCGQRWLATREKSRRRLLRSSDMVPKVLRTPGTAGRWCSASAAGTWRTSSTAAWAACVMRLRV